MPNNQSKINEKQRYIRQLRNVTKIMQNFRPRSHFFLIIIKFA